MTLIVQIQQRADRRAQKYGDNKNIVIQNAFNIKV